MSGNLLQAGHSVTVMMTIPISRRMDTWPIPVTEGWAGAGWVFSFHTFQLNDPGWTNGSTDGLMDRRTKPLSESLVRY